MHDLTVKTVFAYSALALAVCLGSGQALAAPQAPAEASQQGAQQRFDIAAQPLASALNQFSRQTGWEVGYTADLARDVRTQGARGDMTPAEAIAHLLAGTGLGFDFSGPKAILLNRLPVDGSVQLSATSIVSAGELGTYTENSGSYTTGAVAVGGKMPHSLKETPQSVTVMSAKFSRNATISYLQGVESIHDQHKPTAASLFRGVPAG